MYNTRTKNPSEYQVIIAIYWADQKHDLRILKDCEEECKVISSDLLTLKNFFDTLILETVNGSIAIVIESCQSALMNLLISFTEFDIYVVHPTTASKFAKTFHLSGAKSDRADTKSLLELYLKHPDKVQKVDSSFSKGKLKRLNIKRRDLVGDRTRLTNQLTALLKIYYPNALKVVGNHLYADMFLDFLYKYPSPQDVINAHQIGITKFFNKRSTKHSKTKERVQILRSSIIVVNDEDELDYYIFEIQQFCHRIRSLNKVIKAYDEKIEQAYRSNEDYEMFQSFPGADPSIGPRLMAFFVGDRDKFKSVNEVLKISEIAPVTIQSGKMNIVRRRFLCDRFTQLSFVEFANNSIRSSIWAHEFYYHKKALNIPHFTILRALAYKWIRIMYRCWKTRNPYNEKTYLEVLAQRLPAWFQKFVN